MVDFQTLSLCIYLLKFKSNVYLFLEGRSYRVLSVPGEDFDFQPSSVFKLVLLPTPCCFTSREISV